MTDSDSGDRLPGRTYQKEHATDYIPDQVLLESIERVGESLNKSPSIAEYEELGEYSINTVIQRFGSWVEAKEKVGFSSCASPPDESLIKDLQRVADELGNSPTRAQYDSLGEYSSTTLDDRFGSWNQAKEEADLETFKSASDTGRSRSGSVNTSDRDLNYIERVEKYRDSIPDDVAGVYDDLLADGCAPHIAAAVVDYVVGLCNPPGRSQDEVAEEYGTTSATIRRWYPDIGEDVREALQEPSSDGGSE